MTQLMMVGEIWNDSHLFVKLVLGDRSFHDLHHYHHPIEYDSHRMGVPYGLDCHSDHQEVLYSRKETVSTFENDLTLTQTKSETLNSRHEGT